MKHSVEEFITMRTGSTVKPNTKLTFILVFLLVAISSVHAGDKQELKWKAFDAGFAEARKNNKKIMLDIYTDWCGWCKRLDKDTYGNEKVMAYLNEQYVVIKLNAESGSKVTFKDKVYSEASLAQSFGVTGYPTIVFFDSNGEPINSLGGYLDAEKFLPVITYIGGDHYKSMSWQEYQQKDHGVRKD